MGAAGTVQRRYDTETIERGLWTLALHAGRPTAAAEALQAQGVHIDKQTLHRWKTEQHAARYEEIRNEAAQEIALRVAADAEESMLRAGELERKLFDHINTALDAGQIKPGDLAPTLKNVTTTKSLNNDKISAPIRGRPSVITETRDTDSILRKLKSLKIADVIEGQATEQPALQHPNTKHALPRQSVTERARE